VIVSQKREEEKERKKKERKELQTLFTFFLLFLHESRILIFIKNNMKIPNIS